jgi:SAM-dependent methyltransferase
MAKLFPALHWKKVLWRKETIYWLTTTRFHNLNCRRAFRPASHSLRLGGGSAGEPSRHANAAQDGSMCADIGHEFDAFKALRGHAVHASGPHLSIEDCRRSCLTRRMRLLDIVTGFYLGVLRNLIATGAIAIDDSVLVVCGGPLDEAVMRQLGLNATVSNVDASITSQAEDAENLSYSDNSFDVVVVHAGLHHCRSPHRALLEMYRVARKCALVLEAPDSMLMRAAVRLGLTTDYELEAVSKDFKTGGVMNGPTPNFIYRWSEREIEKTIASNDPAHIAKIQFFYDLRIPLQRLTRTGRPLLRLIGGIVEPMSGIFAKLLPKQCNEFGFAITKTRLLQPWMETERLMSRDYAATRKRMWIK